MKRTALKRKTGLRAKTPTKKRSQSKIGANKRLSARQLKDKIWHECKRIVRERYGNTCYTCGARNLEGYNWQTGHGKPKGALPLKYQFDIRNLRPQCMRCNIHQGGVTDVFISRLEQEEEGLAFLLEACIFDTDANAWRIRRDIQTMGGIQAEQFLQNLLEQYRRTVYTR